MNGSHGDPLAQRIAGAIGGRRPDEELYFNRVRFVKRVVLSSISPGPPVAEQHAPQLALLDRCLNGAPGGRILGREVLTGTFRTMATNGNGNGTNGNGTNGNGANGNGVEIVHTRTEILHVGFERRPFWMENGDG